MIDSAAEPQVGVGTTKTFLVLSAGELLARLIGFAGTIYLARRLGVDQYGVIGFGLAILLYTAAIADLGLEYSGPREVVDADKDLAMLVSTMLIVRTGMSLLLAAVQAAGAAALFGGSERTVLAVYALGLLPVGLNARWVHLGLSQSALVSASRVLSESAKMVVLLLFVRGPADVALVPLAFVLGESLAAIALLIGLSNRLSRPSRLFDVALARGVLRRAVPLLASGILALVIYNADLFFLRAFRSVAEVGLYLGGYAVLNFLGILGHLVTLTLTPVFSRLRSRPEQSKELFQDSIASLLAASMPLAVGGAITARLLIRFVFGAPFSASASVLAILICSMPLLLHRSVLQAALVSAKRQDLVLRSTTYAAAFNLAANFIAVPFFGMIGAAVTTVASEAVRAFTAQRYARREGFAAPGPRRFWRVTASVAGMIVVFAVARPATFLSCLLVGVTTYVALLAITGGFRVGRGGVRLSV